MTKQCDRRRQGGPLGHNSSRQHRDSDRNDCDTRLTRPTLGMKTPARCAGLPRCGWSPRLAYRRGLR